MESEQRQQHEQHQHQHRQSMEGSERVVTDPTELTTQLTIREISALKELVFSRLDAIEKATAVAHDDMVRFPTDIQKAVHAARELLESRIRLKDEKIKWLDRIYGLEVAHLKEKFEMVERYRIEQKSDTRTAVDDALKAAKELVFQQNQSNAAATLKTELTFSKLIDQQAQVSQTTTNNFNQRIADIKESQSKSEGKGAGATQLWLIIIALIGATGTVVSIIVNT